MTITARVTSDDRSALAAWFEASEGGLEGYGEDEPRAVADGGTAVVGFGLTTHQGPVMCRGHNRLRLYEQERRAWVRAAGTWDATSWHVDVAHRLRGCDAQHEFRGRSDVAERSQLHQLTLRIA